MFKLNFAWFWFVCMLLVIFPPCYGQPLPAQRVIFFHIDALSWDAPERLQLHNWQDLARQGTRVHQAQIILPWHQTENGYRALSLTSPPNPTTMAGTLFLKAWWEQPYIQHAFYGKTGTAHLANSTAYSTLNSAMNYVRLDRGTDEQIVNAALELLRNEQIGFMRIVLQDSNNKASQPVAFATAQGHARQGDIYSKDSPYLDYIKNADRLLGVFVQELKAMGKFEDSLLVLLSDGNARSGWHPIQASDSQRIPLAFIGAGIAKNRSLDYADSIDIVPSILSLMNMPQINNNGGAGQILQQIRADYTGPQIVHPRYLQTINAQILHHMRLQSWFRLHASAFPLLDVSLMQSENRLLRPNCIFWNLERMDQWHEAKSLQAMIAQNDCAIDFLEQRLSQSGAPALPEP